MTGWAADIHLHARLREWKKAWAEAYFCALAENLFHHRCEHRFQIRHRNIFIDHKPFKLVEHRRMCAVAVVAINSARRDDLYRRLHVFHASNLNRRGLRAKQNVVGYEKGVLHIARRVIFWNVKSFKVVIIGFDLRTLDNLKPHRNADVNQFVEHSGRWMKRAFFVKFSWLSDVDCAFCKLFFKLDFVIVLFFCRVCRFDLFPHFVHKSADLWPILRSDLSHAAQNAGQLALLAEKFDLKLTELVLVLNFCELFKRSLQNVV